MFTAQKTQAKSSEMTFLGILPWRPSLFESVTMVGGRFRLASLPKVMMEMMNHYHLAPLVKGQNRLILKMRRKTILKIGRKTILKTGQKMIQKTRQTMIRPHK